LEVIGEELVVAAFSFAVQGGGAPRKGPPVHGDLRDNVIVDDQRSIREKFVV
jgi:hypothetical protein